MGRAGPSCAASDGDLGNDSHRPITSTLFTTGALRLIPIPAATRRRHGRAGGCLTRTSLTSLGLFVKLQGALARPTRRSPPGRSHFLFLGLFHGPVHSPPALGQAGRRRGSEEEPSPPAPSHKLHKTNTGTQARAPRLLKATIGLNSVLSEL